VRPTQETEIVPRAVYRPDQILSQVQERVAQVLEKAEQVDYLTFVPDGGPSLDAQFGATIVRLRPPGIPIGISNASFWEEV
jgi:wyosine [tRNA(Phe)-imidazoG37] synthetase (radical SAM superfamily)